MRAVVFIFAAIGALGVLALAVFGVLIVRVRRACTNPGMGMT